MPLAKQWSAMSKDEREAVKKENKGAAMERIAKDKLPGGLQVQLGKSDVLLFIAKPKGVSERGSVSYSVSPGIHNLGKYRIRVNNLSISILNEGDDFVTDSSDLL